jgi:hypothetical protein
MGRILLKTFVAIGTYEAVGILLIALLAVGGMLALTRLSGEKLRRLCAAPGGLLAGALVFSIITGAGRGTSAIISVNAQSRYLHIIASLALPSIAVAGNAIAERWRYLMPLVFAILIVGIPGNVRVIERHAHEYTAIANSYRPFILSLPTLPGAKAVPASTLPDPNYDPWMTMGWLLAGVKSGRIPPPPSTVTAKQRADWTLDLDFRLVSRAASGSTCQAITLPSTRLIQKGQTLTFQGSIDVSYLATHRVKSAPELLFGLTASSTYQAFHSMLLTLGEPKHLQSASLCTPASLHASG